MIVPDLWNSRGESVKRYVQSRFLSREPARGTGPRNEENDSILAVRYNVIFEVKPMSTCLPICVFIYLLTYSFIHSFIHNAYVHVINQSINQSQANVHTVKTVAIFFHST